MMRIGVTSQNFRTITGHAGKTRCFLIYETDENGLPLEKERLVLTKEMSMHEFRGEDHPLFNLDILVTAGCGPGFVRRLAEQGVQVIATTETDPLAAATRLFRGESLPPAVPQSHQSGCSGQFDPINGPAPKVFTEKPRNAS